MQNGSPYQTALYLLCAVIQNDSITDPFSRAKGNDIDQLDHRIRIPTHLSNILISNIT